MMLNTIPAMDEHGAGLAPPGADHPLQMSGRGAFYSFSLAKYGDATARVLSESSRSHSNYTAT
jgi:hypothetical protein